MYEPHNCICGERVDKFGHHGLSCKHSAGRRSRHEIVNEIIKRAFISSGTPAIREPLGCSRSDGKRPDGQTLVPWKDGKCLVWDFTCVDTLAQSYLNQTSKKSGSAASVAEVRKISKYQNLEQTYLFVPIAIETLGTWGTAAKKIISLLGHKISTACFDARSTTFLKQRISVAIQRGNAAAVLGTLPSNDMDLDSFFLFIYLIKAQGPP